ncbi:MAG TPA: FecR family protein [Polyangiaceae bacterium]|nr:FecR family protein [Polyangiaceae bacterium]
MSDYLFDKSGDDAEVSGLESLLGAYAHRAPLREPPRPPSPAPPPRPRPRRRALVAAALAFAAVAALALALLRPWAGRGGGSPGCAEGDPGFAFAVQSGAARCGGGVASKGSLPVGAWLETAGGSITDVRVADLGALTVFGDSRLRLAGSGPAEHRFELARGHVSARVLAPPRLFVIDTPVAAAVDLGCAYDLEVDADGRAHLQVTSGAVSLEGRGLRAYVPMGAEVIATPGRGPGTPVSLDASAALKRAAARFDAGDASAGAALVAAAGPNDTVTLWNLLWRTAGADRLAVFRKLNELTIRPPEAREEDVLAGQPQALEAWRQSLDTTWMVH